MVKVSLQKNLLKKDKKTVLSPACPVESVILAYVVPGDGSHAAVRAQESEDLVDLTWKTGRPDWTVWPRQAWRRLEAGKAA